MIPDTIRDALLEIASQTGYSYSAVARVFELCVEASDYGVSFVVADGKLTAVSHADEQVPHHLMEAANSVHNDMVDLVDKVSLVGVKLAGRSLH